MKQGSNHENDRRRSLMSTFSGELVAAGSTEAGYSSVAEWTTMARSPTRRHRTPRRNSIAAMDTRLVPLTSLTAPSYHLDAPDRSYNDLEAITKLTKEKMRRRNSLTQVERHNHNKSNSIWMEYSGQTLTIDSNENLQQLKERFQRRGSVLSGSHHRSSVIGSVVGTGGGDEEEYSIELTMGTPGGLGSSGMCVSIPTSLVQKTEKQNRKHKIERENLIESLVNFSCHTPRVVLEDLIMKELKLWEEDKRQWRQNLKQQRQHGQQQKQVTEDSLRRFDDDMEEASSVSSLSSEGEKIHHSHERGSGEMAMVESSGGSIDPLERKLLKSHMEYSLPSSTERESALLFVDINGFTKLSTMMDVESLSKTINTYFEQIVSEVISHGGDILKFAGDAFFAEWRPVEGNCSSSEFSSSDEYSIDIDEKDRKINAFNDTHALKRLNASLSSSGELSCGGNSFSGNSSDIDRCVWMATKCAASIVRKFSDYDVNIGSTLGDSLMNARDHNGGGDRRPDTAMLNVHCGIGAGRLFGLHVGDYQESDQGQDDEAVELRREYLFLGDAINQVSKAAHVASDGQVMASPEAIIALTRSCQIPSHMQNCNGPVCIAARGVAFVPLDDGIAQSTDTEISEAGMAQIPIYETLRRHCSRMQRTAISRLHLQMALYVHPVVRGDELAISHRAKLGAPQSRHLAEAELRSVYTMFIKALISPVITGRPNVDERLFKTLRSIMHVTSRELDRYSGHLRQFIVDDKGVVLIATFGLRGSTFANLVVNNALPATFDIHKALRDELGVDNRIGATFGVVYCGVVGGIRRHEFSVMGAPVNLAARLMDSKMNKGILVDEKVRAQAEGRFVFRALPPVSAKGYDKPVAIAEPLHQISAKRKKGPAFPFTGRQEEKKELFGIAKGILDDPLSAQSSVVGLIGEAGMGKSSLMGSVINDVKIEGLKRSKKVVVARSASTESEQRIPLCSFRKIFLHAIRELCLHDGTISFGDGKGDAFNQNTPRRELSADGAKLRRSLSISKPQRRLLVEQRAQRPSTSEKPIPKPPMALRAVTLGRLSSKTYTRGSLKQVPQLPEPSSFRHSGTSLNQANRTQSARISLLLDKDASPLSPTTRTQSARIAHQLERGDSFGSGGSHQPTTVIPYLSKLCWVCEQLDHPYEYADLIGSQFLGLDSATPITHVNGQVPHVAELVEFIAQAFMRITNFADLILVFIDDFQWVDSFTWKVIRALGQSGKKMLLVCAMRSHDKQAMRRMSAAVNFRVEITLGPLYLPDIRALVGRVLGYSEETVDDFFCTEIYQRTGGLPVYLVELLEDIKRNKTVSLSDEGVLRFISSVHEGKSIALNSALVMKESLMNRFDALDVRVRKVLQTCAVLGNSFALSDVIRVHTDLEETEIEMSLDVATKEMILIEVTDDDEERTVYSHSTGGEQSALGASIQYSKTSSGFNVIGDRYFQFSHDMWRSNLLTTMLKERKMELHRTIAEALEQDQNAILERSDIARLLTLFDHWKACGDFRKAAPLALAVGSRLNEWDLSLQSLELYKDALEMCFEIVDPVDDNGRHHDEWVKVASQPEVLDLIVRLHIRIAEAYRLIGDLSLCIETFHDAYTILDSSTGTNRSLMVPILSGLCTVKLECATSYDEGTVREQETLIQKFVQAAQEEGNAVHLSRALSMEASFFAQQGDFERALQDQQVLQMVYRIEQHSSRIVEQYHRDYAAECFSQSIQWYYLIGQHEKASRQADFVIQRHLPFQDPHDVDHIMMLMLPAILVLKLMGRAEEAEYIMKRYVVNAYHDFSPHATYWVETFNPICYLLEIIRIEEEREQQQMAGQEEEETKHNNADDLDDVEEFLSHVQDWVLDDANSYYSPDHLRLGHTLMGEICWRLGNLKNNKTTTKKTQTTETSNNKNNNDHAIMKTTDMLYKRSKRFLTPIARDPLSDPFLTHSALAVLNAM